MCHLQTLLAAFVLFSGIAFAAPPVITAENPPPSGTVGEAYFYDFDISPVAQIFQVSNLPPGLMEDRSDYSIAGTPAEAGSYDVVIFAKGFNGEEAEITRRIVIAEAPLPDDTVSPDIQITSKSVQALGGNNYRFVFHFLATDDFGLTGLEYRGAVSGGGFDEWHAYPYLGPAEPFVVGLSCTAFDFEVRAVDLVGNRSPAARYSFKAPADKPSFTGGSPPRGKVGKKFSFRVMATGTTKFNASGLPRGLKLNAATGLISGEPARSGTFSAKITATNAGGATTKTLKFRIAKR